MLLETNKSPMGGHMAEMSVIWCMYRNMLTRDYLVVPW